MIDLYIFELIAATDLFLCNNFSQTFIIFSHLFCGDVLQCCILDQACLNMLISTVRVFCVWPKPYGMVARNIFKILLLEKRNPGGTMRARLHSERMQITQVRIPKHSCLSPALYSATHWACPALYLASLSLRIPT